MAEDRREDDEALPKRRSTRAKVAETKVSFTDEELEAMTPEERTSATAQLAQQEAKDEGVKTAKATKADRGSNKDRLERGRVAAETPTLGREALAPAETSPETEETSVNALLKKQSDRVALSNEQQEIEESMSDKERAERDAAAEVKMSPEDEELEKLKKESPNWDYDPRNPRRVNKPQHDLAAR